MALLSILSGTCKPWLCLWYYTQIIFEDAYKEILPFFRTIQTNVNDHIAVTMLSIFFPESLEHSENLPQQY